MILIFLFLINYYCEYYIKLKLIKIKINYDFFFFHLEFMWTSL